MKTMLEKKLINKILCYSNASISIICWNVSEERKQEIVESLKQMVDVEGIRIIYKNISEENINTVFEWLPIISDKKEKTNNEIGRGVLLLDGLRQNSSLYDMVRSLAKDRYCNYGILASGWNIVFLVGPDEGAEKDNSFFSAVAQLKM